MKYTYAALGLVLALSTGASAKNKNAPAKGKSGTQAALDHDFGCTLDPADLKPWEARGLRVPASSKAHFKLWKSVSALEDFSASAKAKCKTLPPKGAFIKGPGAGTTTRADVVVAQSDVKIYRVYSKAPFHCGFDPPALKYGSWWVLEAPPSDKAAYRKLAAVCNTWNDFSMVVACTLKKGTVVAIGSTQSANCTAKPTGCPALPKDWKASFGSSPEHQVFLNTHRRSPGDVEKFLEGCTSRAY